jgi:hypothetical protein
MFSDVDQQDFIAIDDHLNHDSIADFDGNGRKPIKPPPELVQSDRRVIGIEFQQFQSFPVLLVNPGVFS